MATTIKVKRALSATWANNNPILSAGEIGLEKNTGRIKIGDGIKVWTALPYLPIGWDEITSKPNNFTPSPHGLSHGAGGSDEIVLTQEQVTGLISALALKAPLASPAFTGTPTAPTAPANTNTLQIATTAFAKKEADDAQAFALQRANHTGTQSADTLVDGTNNRTFTNAEKSKLAAIESGAQVNVKPDWLSPEGIASGILNKPDLTEMDGGGP